MYRRDAPQVVTSFAEADGRGGRVRGVYRQKPEDGRTFERQKMVEGKGETCRRDTYIRNGSPIQHISCHR